MLATEAFEAARRKVRNLSAQRSIGPHIRRVAVVLSSSRSGSSLLAKILSSHPQIASLDGEIEPFLRLSGNGIPEHSDGNPLGAIQNVNELREYIYSDLGLKTSEIVDHRTIATRWAKRLLLQFPMLFADDARFSSLLQTIEATVHVAAGRVDVDEATIHREILQTVFKGELWRTAYYDNFGTQEFGRPFNEGVKIEEPPFVAPSLRKRAYESEDADSVLLFKTPADAYRIGTYEKLFPNADIRYVHLTRGFAQTVNGLMDGWLSPVAFFSHDLGASSVTLAIEGYSDLVPFGRRWWKFDLPPNWRRFTRSNLLDVCLNQWRSAHIAIMASAKPSLRIAFEDLLTMRQRVLDTITDYLDIARFSVADPLPTIMAAFPPAPYRWRKREDQILALARRQEIAELMDSLGYLMDPATWV